MGNGWSEIMVFRMGLLIAAVAVLWLTLASAETLGAKVERLNPEPGWAEFESDFWFIVKPLKWTAYLAFVGLLAVLGILQPICNLLWNLVTGIFQVANGICRNLLWPPFHWLLVLCIRIADAIKRVLEFIVRIFFEPLWRYVLRPTLNFCKKRYDFCLVVVGLLMIFVALLDDPEATLLSGSTAMKPLSRFEGLGHCVDDRPALSMSVAAFEIFAYVLGCFVAHPDAAFTLLVAVAGALTLALGLATRSVWLCAGAASLGPSGAQRYWRRLNVRPAVWIGSSGGFRGPNGNRRHTRSDFGFRIDRNRAASHQACSEREVFCPFELLEICAAGACWRCFTAWRVTGQGRSVGVESTAHRMLHCSRRRGADVCSYD